LDRCVQWRLGRAADQTFIADDLASLQVENRLEMGLQLPFVEDVLEQAKLLRLDRLGGSCGQHEVKKWVFLGQVAVHGWSAPIRRCSFAAPFLLYGLTAP